MSNYKPQSKDFDLVGLKHRIWNISSKSRTKGEETITVDG